MGGEMYISGSGYETKIGQATIGSAGIITATGLVMADDKSILLGNSDDFRIRHTGSHSQITDEGTGKLRLGSNQVLIGSADFGETSATFSDDGAVSLYYDNSVKFATTNEGIEVTGFTSTTAGTVSYTHLTLPTSDLV